MPYAAEDEDPRRGRRRGRVRAALGTIAALAFVLVACGESGSGGDGVASLNGRSGQRDRQAAGGSSKSFQEAALAYAECMRKNGADVPDPRPGDRGFVIGPEADQSVDERTFRDADEKCRHLLRDAEPPQLSEEEKRRAQEEMLRFARCMREQGIDMPDPKFDERGGLSMQIGGPGSELDPQDPDFQKAQRACEQHMPRPRADEQRSAS